MDPKRQEIIVYINQVTSKQFGHWVLLKVITFVINSGSYLLETVSVLTFMKY